MHEAYNSTLVYVYIMLLSLYGSQTLYIVVSVMRELSICSHQGCMSGELKEVVCRARVVCRVGHFQSQLLDTLLVQS